MNSLNVSFDQDVNESPEGNYSIKRVQSKFICYAERENNRKNNNLFIRYKAEAMPQGESMQDFCLKNKVPYNLFQKWYKERTMLSRAMVND